MLKYFDKSQYALHDAHAKEVARHLDQARLLLHQKS
mgnify:CR=1 FL=1